MNWTEMKIDPNMFEFFFHTVNAHLAALIQSMLLFCKKFYALEATPLEGRM